MIQFSQFSLLVALLSGAWWLGGRSPQAQMFVLALSGVSLLAAAIGNSLGRTTANRVSGSAIFVVAMMLAFLGMQAFRPGNPAFAVEMDGDNWRLIPLVHNSTLPTGFVAPFDGIAERKPAFTNPLRHLIVFGAAFCATIAAYLLANVSEARRAILWTFVVQTAAVSILSIVHRLTGSTKILWLFTDREFWMGSPLFPYKNTAAAYQVLLIGSCMAIFRTVRERNDGKPGILWAIGITTALAIVALLLLNSRAGVVMGFVLALLFACQEWFKRVDHSARGSRRWLGIGGIALLAVCAGWVLSRGGFVNTLRRFESEVQKPLTLLRGGEPRIRKQQIAVEMAADRPWLGWGGGAYLPLFLTYHPRVPDYLRELLREQPSVSRIHETSADGDWWEFTVEYGIVGVTLLLASLLMGFVMWVRMRGYQFIPSLYLMTAAVLVALHGLIDRILREQIVLAMLGVTLAIAIGAAQSHHVATTPPIQRRRRRRPT